MGGGLLARLRSVPRAGEALNAGILLAEAGDGKSTPSVELHGVTVSLKHKVSQGEACSYIGE
jgi:hypothetical protein